MDELVEMSHEVMRSLQLDVAQDVINGNAEIKYKLWSKCLATAKKEPKINPLYRLIS